MIVNVRMTAFMDGEIRAVNIPDDTPADNVLDEVFRLGQNDFQPIKDRCSVSVGDVIEYDGLHMVGAIGFFKITDEQFKELMAMPRRERHFMAYEWGGRP